MANVIVDPEEMRKFANYLLKLAMDLRTMKMETRYKMHHLNQSWRDNENARFVQQFEQELKPLDKLIQMAEDYRRFLLLKASTLDNYFNTKK